MVKNGSISAVTASAIKNNGEANMNIDQASNHPSSPRLDGAFIINQSTPSRIRSRDGIAMIGDSSPTTCEARKKRAVSRGRGMPKLAKVSSTWTAKAKSTRKSPQT